MSIRWLHGGSIDIRQTFHTEHTQNPDILCNPIVFKLKEEKLVHA